MIEHLQKLEQNEAEQVIHAIARIAVLIAGADGEFEDREKSWAEKITKIRSYKLPSGLKEYYKLVGEDFQNKLDEFIDHYSDDVSERTEQISKDLESLNEILPKLNRNFAIQLVRSYRSFAEHVAEASGGFWGISSGINLEEKRLLKLDMINYLEA
jgi:hypothetical protein